MPSTHSVLALSSACDLPFSPNIVQLQLSPKPSLPPEANEPVPIDELEGEKELQI